MKLRCGWLATARPLPVRGSWLVRYRGRDWKTVYFDIPQQDEWGKAFPLYKLIPYNTDGRRVFGYLRALEEECRNYGSDG